MIAYLPSHDCPATLAAQEALWSAIRDRLGRGPEHLTPSEDPWPLWRAPDLVLAQTSGLPYRARLYGDVELVGSPDYGLPGCPPGHSNSVLVARAGDDSRTRFADFAGCRFAYSDSMSQSGWAAAMMHMRAAEILPGTLLESGSPIDSLRMVAEDEADLAAIDALDWIYICEQQPDLVARLREVERTEPTPADPFITAVGENAAAILLAMQEALETLSPAQRTQLHLNAILPADPADYLAVPTPPGPTLIRDRLAREKR